MQIVLLNQPLWDRTLLGGVRLLEPASRLVLAPQTAPRPKRYWLMQANTVENARDDQAWLEEAIAVFRRTHERLRNDTQETRIGLPVTAGLDSRCTLALQSDRRNKAFLYHDATFPGEERIARMIADHFRQPLRIYRADPHIWTQLPLELETGELHAHQWVLSTTLQALQRDGCDEIFDGYILDSLFNPYRIASLPTSFKAADRLVQARYRYALLGGDSGDESFAEFTDIYDRGLASLGGDPIMRNQRFSLENRSRRYTFGMVRIAQNSAKVRLPGLDRDVLEFGMSLPWRLRHNAVTYRQLISRLDLELARIPSGRTGLPLTSGRRISLLYRLREPMRANLFRAADRLWPSRPLLKSPRTPLERMILEDRDFRSDVNRLLDDSGWIQGVFGEGSAERLLAHNEHGIGTHDVTCGLLTLAALERATR